MRIWEALAAATALAVARAAAATPAAAAAADPAGGQILSTFQLPTAENYSVPFRFRAEVGVSGLFIKIEGYEPLGTHF